MREICDQFYNEISQHFCMEHKGPVTSFLHLNIIRDGSIIAINEIGYIKHMSAHFQMDKAKPAKIPLTPSLPSLKAKPDDKRTDIQSYQELTGSLNHAVDPMSPMSPMSLHT
jgi:hypothetical protein